MTDAEFELAVKTAQSRVKLVGVACCAGTKMNLSDWFLDEAGCPTRLLRAVDSSADPEPQSPSST